ncbi:hypothetical protein [Desertivirga brevis]|uniref:hypothetical protein n=1 Tax=Desertivirga brevis TaxID=2810310 RepID=UPI001A9620FD|nr:hypothetical protein [Pedobacter sp. SYSU D00873]
MSHHFTIYGIDHSSFKTKLRNQLIKLWVDHAKHSTLCRRFKKGISIGDLENLASYLIDNNYVYDWEKFTLEFTDAEVFHFSHRYLGQVVGLLADDLNRNFDYDNEPKIPISEDGESYIFTRSELLDVVNWILLVSYFFDEDKDAQVSKAKQMNHPLLSKAKEYFDTGYFDERQVFELNIISPHFIERLKEDIERTSFDYYYWVNSH